MNKLNTFHIFWQLRTELKVLFTALFINRMGTMVLPFFALYLTHQLHFSAHEVGMIFGFFGAGAVIADFLCGWLLDKLGAFPVMIVSLLISGIAVLLLPLSQNFSIILLITFIWSLANEAYRPACFAVVSDYSLPAQRKAAFSVCRLAINLGMSMGPAIGGFISGKSFLLLFIINGITTLLTGLLLWLKFPRAHSKSKAVYEAKIEQQISVTRDFKLLYFMLAFIPISMVFTQHDTTFGVFMVNNLHFSLFYYGLIFTLNTLLIVVFEVPLNVLTSGWSDKRNLVIGSTLLTLGFAAFAVVPPGLWIFAMVVIWTFGEMFLFPGAAAYVSNIAPAEKRGSYMALYSASYNIAVILGPWAGMYLLHSGGSVALWGTCLIWGIISIGMFGFKRNL